jgi:hypothetical protein
MVTNAEDTLNDEDSTQVRVEHGIRYAIAGHQQGAVRRILLYIVVAIALVFAAEALAPIISVAGIGALLLLAVTDQYA